MNIKLSNIWEYLRSSLWFIPIIMTTLAIALAFGLLHVDELFKEHQSRDSILFYTGGGDNARAILSTIASSMITVAGVVFSITIVTLSLSSTQFGPLLLRTFMKDTSSQLTLGSFVATYIYCLVVLRNVITEGDADRIPNLSVAFALVLTTMNIIVLIHFIHHVSTSIQAKSVIHRVSTELYASMDRVFPEEQGSVAEEELVEQRLDLAGRTITTDVFHKKDGYIQAIDDDALWKLITKDDLVMELDVKPGDHVVKGSPFCTLHSRGPVPGELKKKIAGTIILGYYRTSEQDIEFSIDQLSEIALRALSPSLNDPFTAMACINRLCSALCRLTDRRFPSPYRKDEQGVLRLISRRKPTFATLLAAAFDKVRCSAHGSAAVLTQLTWAMTVIFQRARTDGQRRIITQQADLLYESAMRSIEEPHDRKELLEHYAVFAKANGAPGSSGHR
jgi:uncharacterized membrane protein